MKFINSSSTGYIIFLFDSAPDPLENKINSFMLLPLGWHFGEGIPPSDKIVELAKSIYRIGKYLGLKSNTFPSIEGGIVITFYARDYHCLEISINENREITISHEVGYGFDFSEEFYKESASINDVRTQCKKLSSLKKPNLLELSILDYMIQGEEGSPAIVLKTQPATEGFPSLMYNVFSKLTIPQYAST